MADKNKPIYFPVGISLRPTASVPQKPHPDLNAIDPEAVQQMIITILRLRIPGARVTSQMGAKKDLPEGTAPEIEVTVFLNAKPVLVAHGPTLSVAWGNAFFQIWKEVQEDYKVSPAAMRRFMQAFVDYEPDLSQH